VKLATVIFERGWTVARRKLEFTGSTDTSNAGLPGFRKLADALGRNAMMKSSCRRRDRA